MTQDSMLHIKGADHPVSVYLVIMSGSLYIIPYITPSIDVFSEFSSSLLAFVITHDFTTTKPIRAQHLSLRVLACLHHSTAANV